MNNEPCFTRYASRFTIHEPSTLFNHFSLIMQNKANLLDSQMNVNCVITRDYENMLPFSRRQNKPNQTQFQSQSKPNKPNFKAKQTQSNPNKPNFKTKKQVKNPEFPPNFNFLNSFLVESSPRFLRLFFLLFFNDSLQQLLQKFHWQAHYVC